MNPAIRNWSLCVGRWRDAEVRLHALFPLLVLAALVIMRRVERIDQRVVVWALLVLLVSVALHELVRLVTALRVGGQASTIVLGPLGGLSKIHLPADPPAHLLTALAGPVTYFVLMVAAACGLALSGDRDVLRLFARPGDLEMVFPHLGAQFISWKLLGQLIVGINGFLLLVDLLPVDPCAGAEILRGVLWPVVGRSSAIAATSHVALGMSIFFAVSAILVSKTDAQLLVIPGWFPLAVVSVVLLFGGHVNPQAKSIDAGLAIDELDSDDEEWLTEWVTEDRQAVLVEHLQDKQQEALDRKKREQEANEDARVDDILARLHETSFENLSEEDRAFLKRASRRYQQRRDSASSDH